MLFLPWRIPTNPADLVCILLHRVCAPATALLFCPELGNQDIASWHKEAFPRKVLFLLPSLYEIQSLPVNRSGRAIPVIRRVLWGRAHFVGWKVLQKLLQKACLGDALPCKHNIVTTLHGESR